MLLVLDLATRDGKRRLLAFVGVWCRLMFRLNPLWRIQLSGLSNLDPSRAHVVVANHQSLGDILVAIHLPMTLRFVAKAELFWVPFWGWQARLAGHLRIRRGDRASGGRLLQDAERVLRLGQSVLFFPEGTRSQSGEVGAFMSGAFRLALRTGTPVLPVAISGTRDAIPKGSLLFRSRAYARLHVLPAVSCEGLGPDEPRSLTVLRDRVRRVIVEAKSGLDGQVAEGLARWHDLPRRAVLLP